MSSITSVCTLPYSAVRLSRTGRHSRAPHSLDLTYRAARPLVHTVRPPAPRIIQNTIHQTVVHLHQTTHQHILNRLFPPGRGRGSAELLVRQTFLPPAEAAPIDPSRPALAARRMLRILSAESARQALRPFYREVFQELLVQKQEEYRSRPAQSLPLVQTILGRHLTLTTLRRFYRQTAKTLHEAVVHKFISRRHVLHIRQEEANSLVHRYARSQRAVPEDLRRLPAAKRLPPPPPRPEREAVSEPAAEPPKPAALPAGSLRLSSRDFQVLVRGVADALNHRSRVESLRRGGM